MPLFLLPQTAFRLDRDGRIPTEGAPDQPPIVCRLAASIIEWFEHNSPPTLDGSLRFDVTVFSDLDAGSALVEFPNLSLAVSDVDPPLPTAS